MLSDARRGSGVWFNRRDSKSREPLWLRGFESPPLRHTVWHASLHYGEAMKSARGARFTRGRGRGECQRQRLSVKIAYNSLFAILACPSANRPTFCGEAFSGRTLPDASNYACSQQRLRMPADGDNGPARIGPLTASAWFTGHVDPGTGSTRSPHHEAGVAPDGHLLAFLFIGYDATGVRQHSSLLAGDVR